MPYINNNFSLMNRPKLGEAPFKDVYRTWNNNPFDYNKNIFDLLTVTTSWISIADSTIFNDINEQFYYYQLHPMLHHTRFFDIGTGGLSEITFTPPLFFNQNNEIYLQPGVVKILDSTLFPIQTMSNYENFLLTNKLQSTLNSGYLTFYQAHIINPLPSVILASSVSLQPNLYTRAFFPFPEMSGQYNSNKFNLSAYFKYQIDGLIPYNQSPYRNFVNNQINAYNTAKNNATKSFVFNAVTSGATGAAAGAGTGAAIGSAILPGIGTAFGALLGAGIGAGAAIASSAVNYSNQIASLNAQKADIARQADNPQNLTSETNTLLNQIYSYFETIQYAPNQAAAQTIQNELTLIDRQLPLQSQQQLFQFYHLFGNLTNTLIPHSTSFEVPIFIRFQFYEITNFANNIDRNQIYLADGTMTISTAISSYDALYFEILFKQGVRLWNSVSPTLMAFSPSEQVFEQQNFLATNFNNPQLDQYNLWKQIIS